MNEHIEITHDPAEGFEITQKCRGCGGIDFISDRAGEKQIEADRKRFLKYHTACGAKYSPMNFNKNIVASAVTVLTGKAVLMGEEDGKKQLRAILKAVIELKTNRTINFDKESGILNFISRKSGKTRIVTVHGCSDECDCKGEISYHSALFELIAECAETGKGNVIEFPVKKCFLCGQPSDTGIHYDCHAAEQFWAEKAAA